jgi:deoxyhypusine monooxygenase
MGAISEAESLPILRHYLSDPERTVRETCEIAIAKIEWDQSSEGTKYRKGRRSQDAPQVTLICSNKTCVGSDMLARKYTSVDPAPATSNLLAGQRKPGDVSESGIIALRTTLLDKQVPLFERYRAMFALRNIGTPAAVDALAAGFSDDSALFKCVLSQLSATVNRLCLIPTSQARNSICVRSTSFRAQYSTPSPSPRK